MSKLSKALVDDVAFTESPCETCQHIIRCRSGLACAAFEQFAMLHPWRSHPREPSQATFERLYAERPKGRPRKAAGPDDERAARSQAFMLG